MDSHQRKLEIDATIAADIFDILVTELGAVDNPNNRASFIKNLTTDDWYEVSLDAYTSVANKLVKRKDSISVCADDHGHDVTELKLRRANRQLGELVRFVILIKCPGCDVWLPEHDTQARVTHMEQLHPKIIQQRLDAEAPECLIRFVGLE